MLSEPLRFDRFELQPRERRLLVAGEPAALGARAFDVLQLLVAHAGSLVSKAELLDTVWAGLVVEEANLTVQVPSLRKILGGDLIATVPGRGYRFTGRVQALPGAAVPAPMASAPAPAMARPPARSGLVGRDADLARLHAALAVPGCVTLVGTAGVGKTRLAQAVAQGWPGGMAWVDLAAVSEPPQVLDAMSRVLGQPTPANAQAARLLPALGARLLVLDNAEHLVDAVAALVSALLAAAPDLALLVTAQLPLTLAGERVHRVEPLALPGAHGDTDAEVDLQRGDDALALFLDRVRAADHRFQPGADAGPLLRAICHQLDGLPLALEMAAARVPALGLRGLHDALAGRFAVLTRGSRVAADRHRTLRAALDWSHGLLAPAEARLFRALGVFAGGFTLELVMAVAGEDTADRWAVVDTLALLVERSLVATDHGEPPRYRLLETLRAYALERLLDSGDEVALRGRHASALQTLFAAALRSAAGEADQAAALAEHDNAREALAWSTVHAPAQAVPLATEVCRAAQFTSWRLEAVRWLEACAAVVDRPEVDAGARAEWWVERARQQLMSGRPDAAAAAHARELARASGRPLALLTACSTWARVHREPGAELDAALAEMQSLHDANPAAQPRTTVLLHGTLAACAEFRRDYEAAVRHRRAELAAARRGRWHDRENAAQTNVIAALANLARFDEALAEGDELIARMGNEDSANMAYALIIRTAVLRRLQRFDQVRAEARRLWRSMKRYGVLQGACEWVEMLVAEGRHDAAARLSGFILQTYEREGQGLARGPREIFDLAEAQGRAALGDAAWERALHEGRAQDDAGAFACLGV